jgi:hypothetical protein
MILRHKKTGVTINTKDWEDAEPFQYPESGSALIEEACFSENKDLVYVVDKDYNIIESYVDISGSVGCFNTIEKAENFVVENKKIFSVQDLCAMYVRSRPFGSNKITMTIDLDSLKKSSRSLCGLSKFNFDN